MTPPPPPPPPGRAARRGGGAPPRETSEQKGLGGEAQAVKRLNHFCGWCSHVGFQQCSLLHPNLMNPVVTAISSLISPRKEKGFKCSTYTSTRIRFSSADMFLDAFWTVNLAFLNTLFCEFRTQHSWSKRHLSSYL
jgi:hypothetical protein